MVENSRRTAPTSFTVYDRNGEPAMEVGHYHSYFGTGSDLMSVYDLETGERARESAGRRGPRGASLRRPAQYRLHHVVRLPARRQPASRAYLESFRAMISNTTKPMVMTAEGAGDLEVMWKIACELRGGEEELRAKPYFIMYGEPVSPLKHAVEVLDKLLFCAD